LSSPPLYLRSLFFFVFSFVFSLSEKGSCYRIAPGTLAGAVLGDIALTIFIVGVTYCCASKRRQKKENAEKVYMNVRANCKP
uniref:Hematopoietic cell signal transducer n=1 Tax=Astyanax mexicanus TaxID=7994 RepID=A0A8B9R9F2_ASTMX